MGPQRRIGQSRAAAAPDVPSLSRSWRRAQWVASQPQPLSSARVRPMSTTRALHVTGTIRRRDLRASLHAFQRASAKPVRTRSPRLGRAQGSADDNLPRTTCRGGDRAGVTTRYAVSSRRVAGSTGTKQPGRAISMQRWLRVGDRATPSPTGTSAADLHWRPLPPIAPGEGRGVRAAACPSLRRHAESGVLHTDRPGPPSRRTHQIDSTATGLDKSTELDRLDPD